MDPEEVRRNSLFYRAYRTLERWAEHSRLAAFLLRERVQAGIVAAVVLVSVVRISQFETSVVVQFLSFLALFAVLAVATWSLTDPLAE